MTHLKIDKGELHETVNLPSSKSYANRALILASLHSAPFTLINLPHSSDVTHLVSALKELDLDITQSDHSLIIKNIFPQCETVGKEIFVGEGGTTARFLAGMLCRGSKEYVLLLGERLKERPWDELLEFIQKYGGKAKLVGNKLSLQGPLTLPSEVEMDCSRTTQFASGIQLAFPETKVIPVNLSTSLSYWEMTNFLIQEFKDQNEYSIPLDWSSASYPMAFAALNHKIHFPGLRPDVLQADSKFYGLLKELGGIEETQNGLIVHPIQATQNIVFNVSDCLDLVPTLGYFLGHLPGTHTLQNVSNLVHKESDRLNEVIKLLNVFGRDAQRVGDDLVIKGNKNIISQTKNLILPDDHRMVMAGTLFLLHHNGGEITPATAVEKSYPEFFKLLK